jgi:superoxide dismutase, Cu-Zn family
MIALFGLVVVLDQAGFAQEQTRGVADLKDRDGRSIGRATFREQTIGVVIQFQVKGLSPGLHAVHVHAVGQCTAPAFTSAGSHFNPTQKKHGLNNPEGPHAGDLPNMLVAQDGSGRYEVFADGVTLKGGPASLLDSDGSALVIHAGVDDNSTDPAGNAGDRVACGVITADGSKR